MCEEHTQCMLCRFGNMRNTSHQVAHLRMNSAWVCSNQIYSDSCTERHEREQERDTELCAALRSRCERQRSRWRALHTMPRTTRLAVAGCLDTPDCNDLAGGASRSANARGDIEGTANVGACETRACCSIGALAFAVGTTVGRARAGRCAARALNAIRMLAVPALQATGLTNWAALRLQVDIRVIIIVGCISGRGPYAIWCRNFFLSAISFEFFDYLCFEFIQPFV